MAIDLVMASLRLEVRTPAAAAMMNLIVELASWEWSEASGVLEGVPSFRISGILEEYYSAEEEMPVVLAMNTRAA